MKVCVHFKLSKVHEDIVEDETDIISLAGQHYLLFMK